jgi:DNA repair photolyase
VGAAGGGDERSDDPYQPIEKKLEITRGCLEVLAEARNPVGVITKNHLVTRDIDHLSELAAHHAARVFLSITTLDPDLANRMEPRASAPARRLEAVRKLTDAGIPVGVMVAPVVPGITDHEMPRILEAAAEAGASSAGFVILRLPWSVGPVFEAWLDVHFPDRKEKVLNRVRSMRDGKLDDSRWKHRQRGRAYSPSRSARCSGRAFAASGWTAPRLPGRRPRSGNRRAISDLSSKVAEDSSSAVPERRRRMNPPPLALYLHAPQVIGKE